MMLWLIGLTGLKGSGKSTAASILEEHGYIHKRMAGPLKAMLKVLGLSEAQIDGGLKETPSALLGGKTPRHAMQTLGTEWGRNCISPDLWVNSMEQELTQKHKVYPRSLFVIDDIRFPNEVAMVQRLGGKIWRIDRAGIASDLHASEAHIPHLIVDIVLQNNGTIAQLRTMLEGRLIQS